MIESDAAIGLGSRGVGLAFDGIVLRVRVRVGAMPM